MYRKRSVLAVEIQIRKMTTSATSFHISERSDFPSTCDPEARFARRLREGFSARFAGA